MEAVSKAIVDNDDVEAHGADSFDFWDWFNTPTAAPNTITAQVDQNFPPVADGRGHGGKMGYADMVFLCDLDQRASDLQKRGRAESDVVRVHGAPPIAADTAARTIVAPAELPIGILTALVGAPFFLWLLLRRRGGLVV